MDKGKALLSRLQAFRYPLLVLLLIICLSLGCAGAAYADGETPPASEDAAEAEAVPETEDVPQEAIAVDPTEAAPEETPAEEDKPESLNFSDEDEEEQAAESATAPEKDDAAVARELERIMSAAPAPAPEEPPAEERQEEQPEDGSEEDEPDSDEPEEDEAPGAGRVFGAILVTLPLLLLWIVGLAVFLAL